MLAFSRIFGMSHTTSVKPEEVELLPGTAVLLRDIFSRPELNDQIAAIESLDRAEQRCFCSLYLSIINITSKLIGTWSDLSTGAKSG